MAVVHNHKALISGFSWNGPAHAAARGVPVILTYAFAEAPMPGHDRFSLVDNYFRPLSETERQMVRDGLAMWADVSGIAFLEASPGYGDIEVGVFDLEGSTAGQGAYPNQPYYLDPQGSPTLYAVSPTLHAGDIALDLRSGINMRVIAHEIGHALGLKHPHDADRGDTLSPVLDNTSNTIMSYQGERLGVLGPLDISAIQELYGPAWSDGQQVADWSWDRASNTLIQIGTAADDIIVGTAANDIVHGNGGADLIVTRAGNDIIYVSGMDFQVSAGEGLDFLHVDFSSSAILDIYVNGEHRYLRSATSGYEEMKLFSVERLVYTDGTLAFDTDGNAGQAYRLYQAAFDRTPDSTGLKYWIGRMDEGNTTLIDIADSFLHSPEFIRTYGTSETVSNSHFVELLYLHTLGRGYDHGGYNYWVDRLESGATNRRDLLAFFSDST